MERRGTIHDRRREPRARLLVDGTVLRQLRHASCGFVPIAAPEEGYDTYLAVLRLDLGGVEDNVEPLALVLDRGDVEVLRGLLSWLGER